MRCILKTEKILTGNKKNTSFMLHLYFFVCIRYFQMICACGGTGRRCRLKICWEQSRAGSIPA